MTIERRRDTRYMLDRPIKLQCDQVGTRYLPGQTVNISAGGTMLEIDYPQHMHVGQEVRVAIANTPQQALLESGDFVTGTIIRCLGCNATQHLAIQFHKPQYLAEAC